MTLPGPNIRTLIVKLASRCNLSCEYCYLYAHADQSYVERPRFMSPSLFDAVLDTAAEAAESNDSGRVTLVMHGGEPTLMSLDRFERYVELARRRLGPRLARIAIQTNGTLLTDAWIDCFARFDIDVSVSLDGPARVHDAVRVGHDGRGSHDRVVASIRRLQDLGMDVGTLSVVSPGADGLAVFEHICALGVRRMNFLIPDVSHDDFDAWYGHLGPTPVADFLLPVFDAWFTKDDPEIVVTLFWELIERVLGGPGITDMFGNPTLKYIAVETDGSIESLDALKVGQGGLASTGLDVRRHRLSDLVTSDTPASRSLISGFPLSAECEACRWAAPCAGGYLPHRFASKNGFDNPSVWCRDLKRLFGHVSDSVTALSTGA